MTSKLIKTVILGRDNFKKLKSKNMTLDETEPNIAIRLLLKNAFELNVNNKLELDGQYR